MTIHGQSDQTRLRSPARQRDVVDTFGAHGELVAQVREAHARVRDLEQTLARVRTGMRTRDLEITSLTSALEEIDDARIEPGEDLALREEAARLDNVEHLTQAAALAGAALSGDPAAGEPSTGAVGLLEQASRALAKVSEHDSALADLSTQLLDAAYLAADLEGELGRYVAALEADPDRLDAVHARRARLAQLARSGSAFAEPGPDDPPPGSSDAVLAWANGARTRLAELTDPGQDAAAIEERLAEAQAARGVLAARLTAARRAAGTELAEAVTAELHGLAMPAARVEVDVAPTQPGPSGDDAVTILLTAYEGAAPAPLGVGASGGGFSRVMLALEVVLAQRHGRATTFVFDEVDAGIGGRTAAAVGERLARLATGAQVLVVTHLAQVAAFADRQIVVVKEPVTNDAGAQTSDAIATTVRVVDGEERTVELARMLSGDETDTALHHAADLLARSRVQRWAAT
ncbi:DNA repair protein RecN [Salana multivorans]